VSDDATTARRTYEKGRHQATSRKPKKGLQEFGSPGRTRTTDQVFNKIGKRLVLP